MGLGHRRALCGGEGVKGGGRPAAHARTPHTRPLHTHTWTRTHAARARRAGDGGCGFREQAAILRRFRSGDLNLLVSTAGALSSYAPFLPPCLCLPACLVCHVCLPPTPIHPTPPTHPPTLPPPPTHPPCAVAEEGIDVRSCQLVVRFDLPASAQAYIQAWGVPGGGEERAGGGGGPG